jgi:hypothetical protein
VYIGRIVESTEVSERFLWDLRLTAQELVIENHALHLRTLAHQNGFGLSIEPYDMNPCADLALGAAADVPMCEFWAAGDGFETTFSCFEAASIAHTNGGPIVAAEAFTGAGRYSWTRYPATMKNQADWAFCAGINRLVFHRYAHQPWLDRVPGMTMGPYGTQYERTQTWWEFSRPWHEYLARCQFLLRRGLPVADVLFLTPEGAPHVFQAPPSALGGSREMPDRRGYNFDACAPDALLTRASVKDGKIAFPDGMSYRVLVLPEVETITPGLLRKVKSLLQEGAVVVGMRPKRSPSLADYPRCDEEVRRLTAEIWGPHSAAAAPARLKVGKGLLVASAASDQLRDPAGRDEPPQLYASFRELETLLADLRIDPDFESDKNLRYIHRREGATEIYFISNPANSRIDARCTFRVSGRTAELWDATNGRMAAASNITQSRGRTQVPISLEPHGSIFVIFFPAARSRPAPKGAMSPILQPVTEISGPWEVRFQPGRGAPETITLSSLRDLSKDPEDGIRFFSGTATYRTTFSLPQFGKAAGQRFFLDLERVEVVARVKLNGQDLGIAWRVPFQLEATQALRSAGNLLEVEVANLWLNCLIGDQGMAARKRVAWTTWNPFAKDSPLSASGLIGPVVILSSR